jgi:RNA polymerase sigma factor (sigma-70 family)
LAAVPSFGRASEVQAPPPPRENAAAGDLYNRYADRIYRYCYARLRSREEAEDATQTVFLNAFRGLSRGVTPEIEGAWLYKIAENVCLTRARSTVRRMRVESPTDLEPLHESVAAPTREDIDLEGLQDVLSRLPEQQRRAILLREWQGLSYAEIATALGISQSAVETLIFRARRSVAKGLREQRQGGGLLRKLANAGSIAGWLKSILLGGSAATKVAAIVAAGIAVAAAASTQPSPHHKAPKPSAPEKAPAVAAPALVGMPVLHRPAPRKHAEGAKAQPMGLAPVPSSGPQAHVSGAVGAATHRSGPRERVDAAHETKTPSEAPAPAAASPAPPGASPPSAAAPTAKPSDDGDNPKPEKSDRPATPIHPVVPPPNEHAAPPATDHPQPPTPPANAGPKDKQGNDSKQADDSQSDRRGSGDD